MILPLLIAAQVATSTNTKLELKTTLERALWSAYVEARTGEARARRELAGAEAEAKVKADETKALLAHKDERIGKLEALTSSIARAMAPQACVCPMMTAEGALVCGGIAAGTAVLGGVLARESCGINFLRVP